jgi:hypothetical protein
MKWIVQEITLAKSIILTCGSAVMSWTDLCNTLVFLMTTPWYDQLGAYDLTRIPESHHSLYSKMLSEPGTKKHICSVGELVLTRHWTRTGTAFNLKTLIQRHRFCDSSDPRDRIFALQNISNKQDHPLATHGALLSPDYSLSVETLYTRTVKAMIDSKGDLSVLSLKEDETLRALKGLPSWVPDFSVHKYGESLITRVRDGGWNADNSLGFKGHIDDFESPQLKVSGYFLGLIGETSTDTTRKEGNYWMAWISAFRLVLKTAATRPSGNGL